MAISTEKWREIYKRLDAVSPVSYDCGNLCSKACCVVPEPVRKAMDETDDFGLYLFPGEEGLLEQTEGDFSWTEGDASEWFFPHSWNGTTIRFAQCLNPNKCPREHRPFQCRIFPTLPHFAEDGQLHLVFNDMELPYLCPLIEEDMEINEDFLKETRNAWQILAEDPLIHDLIEMESVNRRPFITEEDYLI